MEQTALWTVIGSIAGGVITLAGVTIAASLNRQNTLLQLRYQQRKEERLRRLEKLENLHELVSRYLVAANAYVAGILLLGHSGKTLEGFKDISDQLLHPLPEISSKLSIYAAELESEWFQLAESSKDLFLAGREYLDRHKKDDCNLQRQNESLNNNCQILLKGLEKIIQQYTNSDTTNNGNTPSLF